MSTRITPVWWSKAATASSELAKAAVWDDAARRPTALRPLFTAMTGFDRLRSRARRANLRGLPSDSRYSRPTLVASSSAHHARRSLPLTSALLPIETKLERPMPALLGFGQDGYTQPTRL